MTKTAIIVARLSVISDAHLLNDYADIILSNKALGVSYRMLTRRAELYLFNHHAQYFTAQHSTAQHSTAQHSTDKAI